MHLPRPPEPPREHSKTHRPRRAFALRDLSLTESPYWRKAIGPGTSAVVPFMRSKKVSRPSRDQRDWLPIYGRLLLPRRGAAGRHADFLSAGFSGCVRDPVAIRGGTARRYGKFAPNAVSGLPPGRGKYRAPSPRPSPVTGRGRRPTAPLPPETDATSSAGSCTRGSCRRR